MYSQPAERTQEGHECALNLICASFEACRLGYGCAHHQRLNSTSMIACRETSLPNNLQIWLTWRSEGGREEGGGRSFWVGRGRLCQVQAFVSRHVKSSHFQHGKPAAYSSASKNSSAYETGIYEKIRLSTNQSLLFLPVQF